mgnify:CR=1 FL=1
MIQITIVRVTGDPWLSDVSGYSPFSVGSGKSPEPSDLSAQRVGQCCSRRLEPTPDRLLLVSVGLLLRIHGDCPVNDAFYALTHVDRERNIRALVPVTSSAVLI